MKKMLILLTILTMLFTTCAFAETTEATDTATPSIVFDESTAAFEGDWLTFDDDGFMVYMPSDWVDADVTDEMEASGTFYAAKSADGSFAMTVSYSEENGDTATNEDLAAQLTASGCENVTLANINGIDVVGYDISAQDVSGMAFMDSEGGMYVFSFTPASNEAFKTIGQTIISSLSPISEDAETAE